MEKKLSTIATSAALIAVLFSLWRDYGIFVTLKRALFSYLVFYGIAALSVMIFKAGIGENKSDEEKTNDDVLQNIKN